MDEPTEQNHFVTNDNDSFLLRIVSDSVGDEEIDNWLREQGLPLDKKQEIIKGLKNSYFSGLEIAEQFDKKAYDNITDGSENIFTQSEQASERNSDGIICERLYTLLDNVKTIQREITDIIISLENRKSEKLLEELIATISSEQTTAI